MSHPFFLTMYTLLLGLALLLCLHLLLYIGGEKREKAVLKSERIKAYSKSCMGCMLYYAFLFIH